MKDVMFKIEDALACAGARQCANCTYCIPDDINNNFWCDALEQKFSFDYTEKKCALHYYE